MDTSLRKLTMVCPKAASATILDALDELDPELPGYSFFEGLGRGKELNYVTANEKVLGAMRMVMILVILPEDQIENVLDMVKQTYRRPQLSYWVEPVLEFGRLQ